MRWKARSAELGLHRCSIYTARRSRSILPRNKWPKRNERFRRVKCCRNLGCSQFRSGQPGASGADQFYNSTLPVIRYELGDYLLCGAANLSSPLKTIKDIGGRMSEALPILLREGREGEIDAHALSGFYVFGLEKIQFVSLRPDRLRIIYVSAENLDVAIRHEFQRLLNRKGAANTTSKFAGPRRCRCRRRANTVSLYPALTPMTVPSCQPAAVLGNALNF